MRQDTPESLYIFFEYPISVKEYSYFKNWIAELNLPQEFTIWDVIGSTIMNFQMAASVLHNMERENILDSKMGPRYRLYWYNDKKALRGGPN